MNIAIIGYGKMGREIERVALSRGHKVVLKIDIDNAAELNKENLKALKVDAAIEFTTPDTAFKNVMKCIEASTPVVCGTTGWIDRLPAAEKACKENNAAMFYASNYGIGVNILFKLNAILAKMMNRYSEYDVTLEETHHTMKKDAPSGTAITLADGITDNLDRKKTFVNHTTTEPSELEVLSIRRGDVPGTHTVTYESPVDEITLTHRAKSRAGLAFGAVSAAEFICGKTGVFGMDDLLGL